MLTRYSFISLCILFHLLVDLPCHAQVSTRATLSVVLSQGTDSLLIQQSAVLLELQNLSDKPQIILHHRPWRDYVILASTPDNSISPTNSMIPNSKRKYSVQQSYSIVYHPFYTPLIENHLGNRQTLVELKVSELKDQGIFVSDEVANNRVYGTILNPGQIYRDLKRIPRKASRYTYTFKPVSLSTKQIENAINVGGQPYRLVLPEEIQSNQLTLLVTDF